MPSVPKYSAPEIKEAALSKPTVDTNAPIEAFGGGDSLAKVGEASRAFLNDTMKVALEEKKKADDLATQEAYEKTVRLKNGLFWGDGSSETGAMAQKGKNAFGVVEQYQDKYKAGTDEIEKTLSNGDQKAMYRRMREKEGVELNGQLQRHAFGEYQKFDEQTTIATAKTLQEDAVLNYTNPGKIEESIGMQTSLIISNGARQGKSDEVIDFEVKKATSETHTGVISRMLANDQDLLASKYYYGDKKSGIKGVKGQLDANDSIRMERAIEEGSILGESQRQATQIMASSGGDYKVALSEARQLENPKVQEATVRELKMRHSENEVAEREADEQRLHNVFNQISQTKDRPDPVTFSALSPQEKRAADSWLEHVRLGTKPATDWDDYYSLKTMASSQGTRESFLKTNLMEYRNKLNDPEFKELTTLQANLRKGDSKADKQLDGYRTDSVIVNDALKAAGINPAGASGSKAKAEKINQFRSVVDREIILFQERTGKKANNNDVQGIVDNLMIKGVQSRGIFWDTQKRAFELEQGQTIEISTKDIPRMERAKIEEALKRRGLPVTDSAVMKLYVRQHPTTKSKPGI